MTEYVYRVVNKAGEHVGSGGSDHRMFARPNQATELKNRNNGRFKRNTGSDSPQYRVQRGRIVWEDLDGTARGSH